MFENDLDYYRPPWRYLFDAIYKEENDLTYKKVLNQFQKESKVIKLKKKIDEDI